MDLNSDNLPNDFYDPSMELSPEYLAQMDAELEQYFQAHEAAAPVLNPAHTALFFGKAEKYVSQLLSAIQECAWTAGPCR